MRQLTIKQKGFVKETIKTKNPTEAVRRIYDIGSKGGSKEKKQFEQTARAIASQNLTKPVIQKSIEELLEQEGITKKEIVKVMKGLLHSTDKRVQIQVLDQLHKILGIYSPEKKMLLSKSEIFQEIKELPEETGAKEKIKEGKEE